jgi:hypothetical protein
MNKFKSIIALLGLLSYSLFGQKTTNFSELAFYADVMVNAYVEENRIYALDKFNDLFLKEIDKKGSYSNDFANLSSVSILKAADASFRIFTWQVKKDNNTYLHSGLVQRSNGKYQVLKQEKAPISTLGYDILDDNSWYGALYYSMMYDQESKSYLIFGLNAADPNNYCKLVDVISFDKDEKVQFGKEIFRYDTESNRPDLRTRISVGYAPFSTVNLSYNTDEKMIIHDYTTERSIGIEGNQSGLVPDGTYVAYKPENGIWQRIAQLENTAVDLMSPDYKTKRSTSKPDILGRTKGGSKKGGG